MSVLFDGRGFAKSIESELKRRVSEIESRYGFVPSMVNVLVGSDDASVLYTKLKGRFAERVGIDYVVKRLGEQVSVDEVVKVVSGVCGYDDGGSGNSGNNGNDSSGSGVRVDGVMVQLPLPDGLRDYTTEVLQCIPLDMDVDGLRWRESGVMPATVKAVIKVLDSIVDSYGVFGVDESGGGDGDGGLSVAVVGSKGMVGVPLVHFLESCGYSVVGVDLDTSDDVRRSVVGTADVVISCAGVPKLISASDVKDGVVLVDVGISKVDGVVVGDVDSDAYDKASVVVPVPGGIGPVTIACLFDNLVDMVMSRLG